MGVRNTDSTAKHTNLNFVLAIYPEVIHSITTMHKDIYQAIVRDGVIRDAVEVPI